MPFQQHLSPPTCEPSKKSIPAWLSSVKRRRTTGPPVAPPSRRPPLRQRERSPSRPPSPATTGSAAFQAAQRWHWRTPGSEGKRAPARTLPWRAHWAGPPLVAPPSRRLIAGLPERARARAHARPGAAVAARMAALQVQMPRLCGWGEPAQAGLVGDSPPGAAFSRQPPYF
jgi:hypothetical protein